jgi:hypothetical protein
VGKQIRAFTKNTLYYAWDCLGEHGSTEQCGDALASSAPAGQEIRYGNIVNTDVKLRNNIICTWSVGYSAVGEEWVANWMGDSVRVPGNPGHYEWMLKWVRFVEPLLHAGKFKPHRQDVREGGFEGILEGMRDLKEGKVSGAKLVYRVGGP